MTRTFSAECDVFAKVVVQADARSEFLNAGQIDALAAMVAESNKRMDAVNRITSNASKIVTNAGRELFAQQPALIAPGGNAYIHLAWLPASATWRSFSATSPTQPSPVTLPFWKIAA
jgi:hypothetical protein